MAKIKPTRDAIKRVALEYPSASDAEKWRLAQAQQLLDEFEAAHGHGCTSMQELVEWVTTQGGAK